MLIAVGTGVQTGGGSVALSDAPGTILGAASAGVSDLAARGDHTHPMPNAADVGAAAAGHSHAAFTGDAGGGGAAGFVPAPVAGDAAAGKFLAANGTWAVPAAGGGGSGAVTQASTSLANGASTTIACPGDAAIVQVLKFIPGATMVDTSLDFDASDDASFVQEDALSGTDLVDGLLTLHGVPSGPATTWSTTDKAGTVVLSNGNNTATGWSNFQGVRATTGLSAGKFMFEVCANDASTGGRVKIGIGDGQALLSRAFCDDAHGIGYYDFGVIQHSASGTNGQPVANYTSGDYIQVAVDLDSRSVTFYKKGVKQHTYSYANSLVGAVFPMACGYSTNNKVTLNAGPTFLYPIAGYLPWQSLAYPTAQAYYVTTSDVNHVSLANVASINSATITAIAPAGTSIKGLLSFDGRVTWKKWDGTAWVEKADGLDGLQSGNTLAEISSGLANHTVAAGETFLDFAFDLSTSDAAVTPHIDLISLNLTMTGRYNMAKMGGVDGADEFGVRFEPGFVRVKNQSGTDQIIKVNILK